MHVGGNHVWHNAFRQHGACRFEGKLPKAMANVKDDTSAMRLENILADTAATGYRRIRQRPKAMDQHGAGAQGFEHFFATGRRKVDMRHHR